MENNEYSARGIFPRTSAPARRREVISSASIGPAPLGALGIVELGSQYSPLRDKLDDLFDRLGKAAKKNPSELVSVPFEGVDVVGGNYEHTFGGDSMSSIRIEPMNFRTVLKPCLDQLIAEKKLVGNPGRTGFPSTPEGYVGLRGAMPQSFGAAKLITSIKQALEEAKRNGAVPKEDVSYERTLDDVTFNARLVGRSVYVARKDIPALAVLGARYDREHYEYRQKSGNVSSTKGDERWQDLIAQGTTSSEHSRG